MLIKKSFIGIVLTVGICFSAHSSKGNVGIAINEIFPNGTIVVGKQPWTINWKIFLERVNDTVFILETYNLDKEMHPIFMWSDTLFLINSNEPKNVLAKKDRYELIYSNKGILLLKGLALRKIKLHSIPENESKLNWCRNKSFVDDERAKIINSNGDFAAEIIDAVYRKESILKICESILYKDMIEFYQQNIKPKIMQRIKRRENIEKIKNNIPSSLPVFD